MTDQPDTNLDLLADPVADVPQPPEAPEVQPVPTFVEAVDPQPVDQHAESGYRPVTGGEIKDYLDAKGMGLTGRPSKSEVTEFLAAKRGT